MSEPRPMTPIPLRVEPAVVAPAAAAAPAEPAPDAVGYDELQRLLRDPRVRVLNALSAEAYAAGHIPGSTSLPLAEIAVRAPRELPDLDQPLIVYCAADT